VLQILHNIIRKAAADALINYFRHGIQPEDVPSVEVTSVLDNEKTKEEGTSS
jgi:hypothetical protein